MFEGFTLSAYLFPLYVVGHLSIFCWALYLVKVHKAPGAWLVAMIAAGLVYDNLIISLGYTIGIGPLLQDLSWPRFAMHAVLTPFMMIAVTQMAAAGGIRWAETTQWRIFIWVLVVAMIAYGSLGHLIELKTVPACFDGILRYTANLYPSHFCPEDIGGVQEAVKGSGPPIPSIVGNIVTLIIGFSLWRHQGWVWLMVGALLMFGAASVPFRGFGMAPGNAGEVLLLFSYVATVSRFGRFRKSAIA
ncbi:MAG: hypothetical protein GY727_09620 [Gammaproteobacteria bacterium]|nr:hypothetical protein [Gammaproteobacteria bacterium]